MIAGLLVPAGMIIAATASNPAEESDPGTTTVAALVLCYGLGAMVWYGLAKLAVMLAIGITVALGLLAGAVPARLAARTRTVEAMRPH